MGVCARAYTLKPFKSLTARSTPSASSNSAKPKPLGALVSGSSARFQLQAVKRSDHTSLMPSWRKAPMPAALQLLRLHSSSLAPCVPARQCHALSTNLFSGPHASSKVWMVLLSTVDAILPTDTVVDFSAGPWLDAGTPAIQSRERKEALMMENVCVLRVGCLVGASRLEISPCLFRTAPRRHPLSRCFSYNVPDTRGRLTTGSGSAPGGPRKECGVIMRGPPAVGGGGTPFIDPGGGTPGPIPEKGGGGIPGKGGEKNGGGRLICGLQWRVCWGQRRVCLPGQATAPPSLCFCLLY